MPRLIAWPASPKPRTAKLFALKPAVSKPSASKPVAAKCDPSKFRVVLDVGHTADSEGAISARNVAEFVFNLRLARRIEENLKADGFPETSLLVTEGKARPSLVQRVADANKLQANLFLSIHHDSVPNKFLEDWEFEGEKRHFSDVEEAKKACSHPGRAEQSPPRREERSRNVLRDESKALWNSGDLANLSL